MDEICEMLKAAQKRLHKYKVPMDIDTAKTHEIFDDISEAAQDIARALALLEGTAVTWTPLLRCEELLLNVVRQGWEMDGLIDTASLRTVAEAVEWLEERGKVEVVREASERWLWAKVKERQQPAPPSGDLPCKRDGDRGTEDLWEGT